MVKFVISIICLLTLISLAHSEIIKGQKELKLIENDGTVHVMADVSFSPEGEKTNYSIEWKTPKLAEHFLSMRPFKCIEGTSKHWCRVPYPYEIKRNITPTDLTDLEYDTLFIWKGASEYGINMWNGVYYKMEIQGDKIVGKLNDIDMNILAAPPEAGNLRPVQEFDIEAGDPESHWLPTLVIE